MFLLPAGHLYYITYCLPCKAGFRARNPSGAGTDLHPGKRATGRWRLVRACRTGPGRAGCVVGRRSVKSPCCDMRESDSPWRIVNTREPEWRNGRRAGFKIQWPQGRVGSSPTSGTSYQASTYVSACLPRQCRAWIVGAAAMPQRAMGLNPCKLAPIYPRSRMGALSRCAPQERGGNRRGLLIEAAK